MCIFWMVYVSKGREFGRFSVLPGLSTIAAFGRNKAAIGLFYNSTPACLVAWQPMFTATGNPAMWVG